jgi:hypothetical protein
MATSEWFAAWYGFLLAASALARDVLAGDECHLGLLLRRRLINSLTTVVTIGRTMFRTALLLIGIMCFSRRKKCQTPLMGSGNGDLVLVGLVLGI